ncbi:MAG: hypothetical protein E7301_04945 [Butyrivibrio sp.]|nr:hypothetical protein [Butyrivibrio sp.]
MKHFSRIGATALALALSVTFVTPTTVLAAKENYDAREYVRLERKKTNDTYSDGCITTDVKVVGQYDDYNAMIAAAEAAGYYKDDEWVDGYAYEDRYNAATSKYVYFITYTTYKNEITGQSSAKREDVDPDSTYAQEQSLTSKVYIDTDEVTLLGIQLRNGDTTIKKVKSSKKKVVTAKLDKKNSSKSVTNDNVWDWDRDSAGNCYYYTTTGTKVILPKDSEGNLDFNSDAYKNSNASSGMAYIALTPKKSGTSKVSFDIYNRNNVKTGSASITVVARSDSDVFKKLTFGGKSLIEKKYGDTNYIDYGRKADDTDNGYTTKTKGKLVVKANKGYKITKIEVGKLTNKTENGSSDIYFGTRNIDNEDYTSTTNYKGTNHFVDLNGDGDYLDTVRGQSESNSNFTFKTIKSGKTLKLSTVAANGTTTATNNSKKDKNANGELVNRTTTGKYQENLAPTVIRITYYDKDEREYRVKDYTLWRKAKVKKSKK